MNRNLTALLLLIIITASATSAQTANTLKISNDRKDFPDLVDDFGRFGGSVRAIGDLDSDGDDEIAVGGWGGDFVQILFPASDGTIENYQRIGQSQGGFTGQIDRFFGSAVAPLGDLDGDGVCDLAVGESFHDGNRGAVWILFLQPDGRVKSHTLITQGEGGFVGALVPNDRLGSGLASLGDLDGDGVADLAVGAEGTSSYRGSVYVLFLNTDGTVESQVQITEDSGGFAGTLETEDLFGETLAAGDWNDDGVVDLAVGAPFDDLGGPSPRGAVYLLELAIDGTVQSQVKLGSPLAGSDAYGAGLAFVGDLNDDGALDLAVAASNFGASEGAVFVHLLDSAGAILATQQIDETSGGFLGTLDPVDQFGASLGFLGDLDGDGFDELAVGATGDDGIGGSGGGLGAVWRLDLDPTGFVVQTVKIGTGPGGTFPNTLEDGERFGTAVAPIGDLDGDGVLDLVVGAEDDDTAGNNAGAVWVLFLNADGTVKSYSEITQGVGGFTGLLQDQDDFGAAVAPIGDLDGNGRIDIAVGVPDDDATGSRDGSVWILFLNADGSVLSQRKIGEGIGGFGGSLDGHAFGRSLAPLGDLDGDGVFDLAVGEPGSTSGAGVPGSVWILFLNANGTVKNEVEITQGLAGLPSGLADYDEFGAGLSLVGDFDGDGVVDLVAGAPGDDDGGSATGAVWILLLQPDGTVKDAHYINTLAAGLLGEVGTGDGFGRAVAATDLDEDGVFDLLVGAPFADGAGVNDGAVWRLYLNADGTVKAHERVGAGGGAGFDGVLVDGDNFGASLGLLGDFNGDGVNDWAVGMPGSEDGGVDHGALWLLFDEEPAWELLPYGCDGTAEGSLVALSGIPAVGADLELGVDNPLGTQAAGSLPLVLVATAPDPAFPCGTPIPGLGLAGGGAPAELLISFLPPNPVQPALSGAPWTGTEPAPVTLSIPPQATLAGVTIYAQGALLDASPGATLPIALTAALALTLDA
ncbi:MAG: hypothetical protein AAF682_09260 [Planctomycetota bacterium]